MRRFFEGQYFSTPIARTNKFYYIKVSIVSKPQFFIGCFKEFLNYRLHFIDTFNFSAKRIKSSPLDEEVHFSKTKEVRWYTLFEEIENGFRYI